MFKCVIREIHNLPLPIIITLTRPSVSLVVTTYLSSHDVPDGHLPISFLVFQSNPAAYVSLPKFCMHCSFSVSQPTVYLFISSYQHQFPSRPDIFLSNTVSHLKYALILTETNTRFTPAWNKQQNHRFFFILTPCVWRM
jgi:hypothetical protein